MSDKRYPYNVLAVPTKDARPRTEDPISIAVAALASIASSVAGAAAAGTLASLSLSAVLASAAVSALVAGAASLLTPKPETPSPEEIVRTIRQPLSYRQTVYGRTRVNTYLFYADTTNDKNDLHLVLGVAGHEIDAVEEIWFDDQMVWQNGSYIEIDGTRRTRHTYTLSLIHI